MWVSLCVCEDTASGLVWFGLESGLDGSEVWVFGLESGLDGSEVWVEE